MQIKVLKELLDEKVDQKLNQFFQACEQLKKLEDEGIDDHKVGIYYSKMIPIYEELMPMEHEIRKRYPMCNGMFDYLKKKSFK